MSRTREAEDAQPISMQLATSGPQNEGECACAGDCGCDGGGTCASGCSECGCGVKEVVVAPEAE